MADIKLAATRSRVARAEDHWPGETRLLKRLARGRRRKVPALLRPVALRATKVVYCGLHGGPYDGGWSLRRFAEGDGRVVCMGERRRFNRPGETGYYFGVIDGRKLKAHLQQQVARRSGSR